ncbi:hypothetical protein [Ruminococcus sp. Marseille-P6503]|uniref:hypothetical protein n=1 Tax=Ruminococcus sp. Marseille-P6503 TaxID=2364796 RepID=UPI000F51E6DC|nr:hypothetical protein [Ruminococcus sp. Marseille-P6503]
MKKIIFAQILTTNGTTEFSGLYDENGDPVIVETERDDSGVSLTIWRNAPDREQPDCGISEEEIERTCAMHDDCGDCPLYDYCGEETEVCS